MKKVILKIEGMNCAHCALVVERAIKRLNGALDVRINLTQDEAILIYDPKKLSIRSLVEEIGRLGYGVEILESPWVGKRKSEYSWIPIIIGILSGIFVFFMMHLHVPLIVRGIVTTPILMYVAFPIFRKGIKNLLSRNLTVDAMYTVGIVFTYAASILATVGYFPESFGIYEDTLFLASVLLLGKTLEERAKNKSLAMLEKLMELKPKEAIVIKDGKETKVSISSINEGDVVLVRRGDKIPVDGVIVGGEAFVDERLLTGEPIPKSKKTGDLVLSGSINLDGLLRVKAIRRGEDSLFEEIIKVVREAQSSKPPIQNLANRIVSYFLPIVGFIALFSFAVWTLIGKPYVGLISFIAVIVVACPCAFGLATPMAVSLGLIKTYERGILIKDGKIVEILPKAGIFVFDKTGTLTKGEPKVINYLHISNNYSKDDILGIVHELEKKSSHPFAKALLEYTENHSNRNFDITDFSELPGKGIWAKVNESSVFLGRSPVKEIEDKVFSVVCVVINGEIVGYFKIFDPLKEEAREVISKMKSLGKKVMILTGDSRERSEYYRNFLEVDDVISEVLPQEKERVIKELREKFKPQKVVFIGDGINDAPALAVSDVGIALVSGSDIAIESGDVVLMKNDIRGVLETLELSGKIMRKIKQNFFWASIYNVVLIPFAAGLMYVLTGVPFRPEWSAMAMILSDISVILNTSTLARLKAYG